MCYSARIKQDYQRYVRDYGVQIGLKDFVDLFWTRAEGAKIKIPRAMAHAFANPQDELERKIKSLIDRFDQQETVRLQQELFGQRARLAGAERKLAVKMTKAASESQRIANKKIAWALARLADMSRTDLVDEDSRIYPGDYAPVMIVENGQRVLKPMRFQCLPNGKPAFFDVKYPGTYNARRDSLDGYWKGVFGVSHGVTIASAFYEHVIQQTAEGIQNVVLKFEPRPREDMLVACLWSHWQAPGSPDLLSFAFITDEPPAEVAAAGHDRCIVPLKAENLDRWLNPDPAALAEMQAILDDRWRPFYEHQLAA